MITMPKIVQVHVDETVECDSDAPVFRRSTTYLLSPIADEIIEENGERDIKFNKDYTLRLPIEYSGHEEIYIKHQDFFAPFRNTSYVVGSEQIINNCLRVFEILDPKLIARFYNKLQDNPDLTFPFVLDTYQNIELMCPNDIESNVVEQTQGQQVVRSLTIRSHLRTPITLRNYMVMAGNLDDEIVWNISMSQGGEAKYWMIQLDHLQVVDISEFRSDIQNAILWQREPVKERLRAYLTKIKGLRPDTPLYLIIRIPEIQPEIPCTILLTLKDPSKEIFFATGIEIIDNVLRDINLLLSEHSLPLWTLSEQYQQVLTQLLLYRYNCSTQNGFISAEIASLTEINGFHRHLMEKISNNLSGEIIDMHHETEIGNCRVDLLLNGIPAELKLEDRKRIANNDEIINRFKNQAADYVGRMGNPFGFLLVLDTITNRDLPTSNLSQDVSVQYVRNVSGNDTIVIVIIIRIPMPASEHTKNAIRMS